MIDPKYPEPKRRAADVAYEAIEAMICTLQLPPGSHISDAPICEHTGLGRTPVREALLRMVSIGLITQMPRRGLVVSNIDLADHLDVIQTRRALEGLIASCAARRASAVQRADILRCAQAMVDAAQRDGLDEYMRADRELDLVIHAASQNHSAVKAVIPLIVLCRRFWYAYQHEGDVHEGARAHMQLAQGIASGNETHAIAGATQLMDYLDQFARRIIER